jgi:hypothetical protein
MVHPSNGFVGCWWHDYLVGCRAGVAEFIKDELREPAPVQAANDSVKSFIRLIQNKEKIGYTTSIRDIFYYEVEIKINQKILGIMNTTHPFQ